MLKLVALVMATAIVGGTLSFAADSDAFLWIAGAGLAVVASGLFMHRLVGVFNVRRLTFPGLWFLTYLIMLLAPALAVAGEHPGPVGRLYLLAVLSLLVTVPIGVATVNLLMKCRGAEIADYLQRPVTTQGVDTSLFVVWLVGLASALAVGAFHVGRLEAIPVVELLRGAREAAELSLLREESLKLLDRPSAYVFGLLRAVGIPFLMVVAMGAYLGTHERRWLLAATVSGVLGIGYASVSLARGPVAELVIVAALYVYMHRKGLVRIRGVLAVAFLALAFPVTVNMLKYGIGFVDAAEALGIRLLYTPAQVLYLYFELFSGSEGMLSGRSIGILSWVMGWDHFDTANYIGLYALRSRIDSVNANAAFIGNLYADFSMLGVLGGGIVAGAIMQAAQVSFVRARKDVVAVASYSYLLLAFWKLHSTALPVVLVTHGVLVALFLPWLVGAAVAVVRVSVGRPHGSRRVSVGT